MGPLGFEHLDIEATGEMLLKISLAGIIKDDPNIDVDRLINHLYRFYYRSQAVNQEFLSWVRNKKPIFTKESILTLEKFMYTTNLHPRFNYREHSYKLDEYLLGNDNWREASTNSLRPEV